MPGNFFDDPAPDAAQAAPPPAAEQPEAAAAPTPQVPPGANPSDYEPAKKLKKAPGVSKDNFFGDEDDAVKPAPPPPPPPPPEGFFAQWWKNLNTPFSQRDPAPPANAVDQFIRETVMDPAIEGGQKAKQIGAILASSVRSKEATAETIAATQQAMEAAPPKPEFMKQGDEALKKENTILGALGVYVHNPHWAVAQIIQGMTESGGVMAAGAAGGAEAGIPGMAIGAGGSQYLQTYGDTVLATLSANGVDLADKDAVLKAFGNKELMDQANAAAAKAGVPAAIISAVSFALMGNVGGPVGRAVAGPTGGVARQVAGRAAGVAAEAGVQGGIGAGGEAATQLAQQGQISDPGSVARAGASNIATTLPFVAHGAAAHDPLGQVEQRVVEAGPANAMEAAQSHAAQAVAREGGDTLSQVVAATQANAGVGAVHDAAAVHGARQARSAAAQEAFERDQAFEQAEAAKQPATTPEQGFEQAEADQTAAKDQDYTAAQTQAKNQEGDQAVEAAKTEAVGAEKGGALEPKPTLAEALPPEQLAALQSLKERRAAAAARPAPEPSVVDRMRANDKGTEFDYKELPPETPKRAPTEAQAPLEDEGEPTGGPPPVKATDLAARRQAALDAAMAQKLRNPPAVSEKGPGEANSTPAGVLMQRPPLRPGVDPAEALAEAKVKQDAEAAARAQAAGAKRPPLRQGEDPAQALMEAQVKEDADRAAKAQPAEEAPAKPNRLAAIRAAAEKRQAALPNAAQELINEIRAGRKNPVAKPGEEEPGAFNIHRNMAEDLYAQEQSKEPNDMNEPAAPTRMTKSEAVRHLNPIAKEARPGSMMVHDSQRATTIPARLKGQIDLAERMMPGVRIKGAYDQGVVHIFADNHKPGDKQDLLSTTVHERAHLGSEGVLGKDHAPLMEDLGNQIKDTAWAKRYAGLRNFDLKNPKHVMRLGDEYVAHMAENQIAGKPVHSDLPVLANSASHWKQVLATFRQALRRYGIVKHWSDNDIAHLIREGQSYAGGDPLKAASEGQEYKDSGGARFSFDNSDQYMGDHYDPEHPLAVGHKLARTVEEQGKYNPGFVRDATTLMKDLGHGKPDAVLGAIGLRNIPDFIHPEKMPNARGFIEDHDAMEGRRRQVLNPSIERAQDWSRWQAKQPDRGEALSDLMHASTLSGHDPSKPYEERYTAAERAADPAKAKEERYQRAMHESLKDSYNKLDPKGQELFNKVRDDYDAHRTMVMRGIEDRIRATGADEQTKKNALSSLRKAFESGKVKGAYFPLQRFGDLWANAKDEKGNTHAFARFESRTRRKEWMAEMRKQGFAVDADEHMDQKSEMERISPEFVKNVLGHIEAADPTGTLAKDVWQEYLKAMPEMSMRKHMITRVGRLGFSGDALRAYAYNMFHGAHQLARLEYGQKLDNRMEGIKAEARALGSKAAANPDDAQAQSDAKWAPAIAREMAQRYDWLRNPRSSKLASALTRFGFSWYLGAAPATAFRIFSQNPMLAAPMLAKHFGWLGASKELTRASAQWAAARGYLGLGDKLRGDERRAFDEANNRGVFSDTNTQTMAAGGDGSPLFQGPWYQFQKYAGYMFNAMEHHNRMTTHLAAYRLGRTKGMDHDSASSLARQITWDSHFDYTNANRPRYLQGNVPKVIGLFKQYSLGVTYRLAREGADLVNSEKTPEQRAHAAVALSGLIGRMMLFAGATGIPGYWIAEKIVNAWMGNQDKPYDMTAALHKHLNDTLGQTAGDAIMTGPVGAISGASLSSGASYNDLWYKEPMRNEAPKDEMYDALGQLMGPIGALPINAAQGASQMKQGNIERGLEHFLPPEAAALAKTVRYATQGVTNTAGQNLLPPGEQLTNKDLFLQSIGFTPQKVADAYRRNAAIKNVQQGIEDRRKLLSDKYETATLAGDTKTAAEVWGEIQKFNETNPGVAIGKSLASGAINKAKRNATAVQGVNLPPGLQNLQKEY